MPRAFIIVLDSVGIGGAPDARLYGDEGADTIGHIADACASGAVQRGAQRGPLRLPNLVGLGLGDACRLATGRVPPGLERTGPLLGSFGCAAEASRGKDTPSGHWEIAGLPVGFDWHYFPRDVPCFPPDLIGALVSRAAIPGVLGNCHASGTRIIEELGDEHVRSGMPICYTSADSVFQIAAHEEAFGLERLYAVCSIARELLDPTVGRVIARPFTGTSAANYARTANRRDYATPPIDRTILDIASDDGRDVITIGKIGDIFAHHGTGRVLKGDGNAALFSRTLEGAVSLADGGLLFANFIDFDTKFGHRRDVAGYATALEQFDADLPRLLRLLDDDDLLILTADHGCDPTWRGTDHTREQVPILAFQNGTSGQPIGRRKTFADIAASVAEHLALHGVEHGQCFLERSEQTITRPLTQSAAFK